MHPVDNDAVVVDRGRLTTGAAALTVVTVERDHLVIVAVHGTIDALTASQLSEAVEAALTSQPRGLIIDLSSTKFLASAGMAALVAAHEAIASTGHLAVVADGSSTARPIRLVGLDKLLTLHATLDDAIEAMT